MSFRPFFKRCNNNVYAFSHKYCQIFCIPLRQLRSRDKNTYRTEIRDNTAINSFFNPHRNWCFVFKRLFQQNHILFVVNSSFWKNRFSVLIADFDYHCLYFVANIQLIRFKSRNFRKFIDRDEALKFKSKIYIDTFVIDLIDRALYNLAACDCSQCLVQHRFERIVFICDFRILRNGFCRNFHRFWYSNAFYSILRNFSGFNFLSAYFRIDFTHLTNNLPDDPVRNRCSRRHTNFHIFVYLRQIQFSGIFHK